MKTIDHGEFSDPWRGPEQMTEEPWIHETSVVKNCRLGAWTVIGQQCEMIDSDLMDYSYLVKDAQVFNSEIRKFVNIASSVRINPTNHPMWRATLHHFAYRSISHLMADNDDEEISLWRKQYRTIIEPDVWIGHGAIVMPGVKVGTGAVIGSGAIVTKDVADYAIVAGNPAKLIRYRVPENIANALKLVAWWDWSREQIIAAIPDFRALDAVQFAKKYGSQYL